MIDYINVVLADMPVNEAVTENEDGGFTVFINSRLSRTKQRRSFLHALRHIVRDDFHTEKEADRVEHESH